MYLNQKCADYCEHMGTYAATSCMIVGVILFQVGHAYKKHRKDERNKRKNLLTSKTREGSKIDHHNKDCPKHTNNHYPINPSIPEAKKTVNNKVRILDGYSDAIDNFNSSEDSSNCEDQDDDEGTIFCLIS